MADNARLVRASEIGEYLFCHRAWWLHHVQGWASAQRAQMEHGIAQHRAHGRAVQRAERLTRAAIVLAGLAVFFAVLYGLAVFLPAF